jgi:hypothetical protein
MCFTHMLQTFYLDVAYDCNDLQVFSGVLQVFQLFQTYVTSVSSGCSKIDLVLHMMQLDHHANVLQVF